MARHRRFGLGSGAFLFLALSLTTPARAQFGAIEAFLRNVTDLSFYGGLSGLAPSSSLIKAKGGTMNIFGVELLFEIGSIDRPVRQAARPAAPRDSIRSTLVRMEVRKSAEGLDTLYVYEVQRNPPPRPAMERRWTFEMGIGYGQISGFELRDPKLELRGSIRDLPSASIYANYDPINAYFGLRTGLMKTQALQTIDRTTRGTADGTGEAFFIGTVAGYAASFSAITLFLESAYTVRRIPSLQWIGDAPIRAVAPRYLPLSGWTLNLGIQIGLKTR